jgi:hypothetical protein
MTTKPTKRVRCAVYTRVSTEYGLDQEFNSLDAQHEAAEAYVRSQAHDGPRGFATPHAVNEGLCPSSACGSSGGLLAWCHHAVRYQRDDREL